MKIKFVPQDIWIGLYFKTERPYPQITMHPKTVTTFYLCLIPCFPIIWSIERES